jgi:predicted MFS family arabinose efflux permease
MKNFFSSWLDLKRLPRRVWALAAAALVNRMGTMALPFMTLYLTNALGWPATRAAAMLGLYGAVALVAGPWGGALCDRFGASKVMRVSLTGSSLMLFLFPFAKTAASVAVLTVVWAAFSEAFRPANMAAVTESAPEDMRKQAYALHRAAINLGMSVGPAAGGLLAAFSYSYLWWIDGATSLAAALMLWRGLEGSPAAAVDPESAPSARGLADPKMRWFIAANFLLALIFFQHESALSIDLTRSLGASPAFFGFLFTINTILIVAVEIPLNKATAHWSHRRTMFIGAFLFALGFGGYGLVSLPWHAMLATVVWTFGEMIQMPGASSYVASIAPANRRGEYMGLYIVAYNAGFAVGPWLGMMALEHWGSRALWAICFVVGCASAWVFGRLDPPAA